MIKHHPNFKDLTGQRFGRLVVLSYDSLTKSRQSRWLCRCDCGTEKIITGDGLKQGDTKSCGCLHLEIISLAPGQAMNNRRFRETQTNAKSRNYSFTLSREFYLAKTLEHCFYCGSHPPIVHKRNNRSNGDGLGHGLDRVDNERGYTEDNVVSCCKRCNLAKHTMGQEEFIRLAHAIAKKHPII